MVSGVIFLDVDGVLNRVDDRKWGHLLTLPQPTQELPLVTEYNIVEMLNNAVGNTKLKIVVSSTWRKISDNAEHFYELTGVDKDYIHFDWTTGHFGDRGDQITEWLYRHPEVTHHVILDDNDYNFAEYKDRLNFVKTDALYGLSFENLNEAFKYFGLRVNRNYSVSSLGGPTQFI